PPGWTAPWSTRASTSSPWPWPEPTLRRADADPAPEPGRPELRRPDGAGPGADPHPGPGLDRLQPERPRHRARRTAGLADRDAAVPGRPGDTGQHGEVPQA